MDDSSGKRPPIMVIAPAKYVQGPGALDGLHTYLEDLGSRAIVICTESSWDRVGERISWSAEKGGLEVNTFFFNGESSRSQVEAVEETESDIVIGPGGGKVIDTAKSVAEHTGAKCVILPTIASTDAPTSALSVIYTDDGDFESYEFHKKNPDLVLLDSEVSPVPRSATSSPAWPTPWLPGGRARRRPRLGRSRSPADDRPTRRWHLGTWPGTTARTMAPPPSGRSKPTP